MRRILLTIRDRDDFIRNTCFPFIKGVRFENVKRRPEIDDFAILSLARLLMWRPNAALIDNGNIDNTDLL